MALLKDQDREHLKKEFETLADPVKVLVFTQERECQYCHETRMIAEEVAALSDKISVEVYDLVADKEVAEHYQIDKIPATVVMRGGDAPKDYGIRYFGIPSGYEFSSLIEDIMMVSRDDSGLSDETKGILKGLTAPLHLQVFVTPTCPYCPGAVRLAHQLALESDLVRADMVEAIEFPHLSMKYQVQGVPRTVINETTHMEGMAPEHMLMDKVKQAIAV
ncbi:MAG: thioredoxin family protein [Anaerolineae bacterium]|nr:thioredoxin family protein [Anaerolineae bacterium]